MRKIRSLNQLIFVNLYLILVEWREETVKRMCLGHRQTDKHRLAGFIRLSLSIKSQMKIKRSSDAPSVCVWRNIIWAEDQQVCPQSLFLKNPHSYRHFSLVWWICIKSCQRSSGNPRTICPGQWLKTICHRGDVEIIVLKDMPHITSDVEIINSLAQIYIYIYI